MDQFQIKSTFNPLFGITDFKGFFGSLWGLLMDSGQSGKKDRMIRNHKIESLIDWYEI